MERMVIKHTSGSKANQVEEFPLNHYSELILGRETGSTVQYDADRDDLVGRHHAKISRDPADPHGFILEDTGSRNGTYLNGVRISEPRKLQPGDRVHLGTGGPEFTFDVEPRPAGATKATRIAEVATSSTPATRIADSTSVVTATAAGKPSVGKATVERMIGSSVAETKRQQTRKFGAIGAVAAVLVLLLFGAVIAGGYWYSSRQQAALQSELASKSEQLESKTSELKTKMDEGGFSASEITTKNEKAVVYLQLSWRLINKDTKAQIYHQFYPNSLEVLSKDLKKDFGKGPIIPNGGNAIPIYFRTERGIEPMLTDKENDLSEPIGYGSGTCSGFIVTTDGFILTNKHCTSPWKSEYGFPQNYPKGILLSPDLQILGAGVDPPSDWIPENHRPSSRAQYQGEFDATQKITVMLPGSDTPIEATKIQDSPRHDVGMLKISVPGNLPKVELYDAGETLKKGDGLVIMGYPGSAPRVYAPIASQNPKDSEVKFTVIPDPTTSVTSVGNIVKNSDPNDLQNIRKSDTGDSIRYPGSLTYGGNSGGPVFDMQGRVIGLHYLGSGVAAGNIVGYAVPIKYGLQLFPGGAPN